MENKTGHEGLKWVEDDACTENSLSESLLWYKGWQSVGLIDLNSWSDCEPLECIISEGFPRRSEDPERPFSENSEWSK